MSSEPSPRSRRDRPAKPALSREAIVDAALAIVREEGIDALTMRRLAQSLDTGPASLYVYVANRDELWDLVFDEAIGSIETEPTDPARWREQVHALAGRMVNMMVVEYPGMARMAMARIPVGDNALRVNESMLSLLKAGGVGDQAAAYAADLLSMYVTATAYEQSLYAQLYSDPEHEQREVAPHRRALRRDLARALPHDRRPAPPAHDRRRRGALLAGPRRHHQRAARDPDRGTTDPQRLGAGIAMSERWFIVNVGDADWESKGEFGVRTRFESPDDRFAHFGITVQVLQPGQPSGLYHAEEAQEGFLVLAGECLAVIDGQEHALRQWDYFHCPPGTRHVLVGAGDGPCAVLMVGAPRSASLSEILYPQDPVAARHGASATETTRSSKQAYADRSFTGPRPTCAVARRLTPRRLIA